MTNVKNRHRGKPTHVSKCEFPRTNHKQTHMSREERIKALQKIYDESCIDVNAEEIFIESEREYAETHKKEALS